MRVSAAYRKYGIVSGHCPKGFPLPVPGALGRLSLPILGGGVQRSAKAGIFGEWSPGGRPPFLGCSAHGAPHCEGACDRRTRGDAGGSTRRGGGPGGGRWGGWWGGARAGGGRGGRG